jgi:hypothetical protein
MRDTLIAPLIITFSLFASDFYVAVMPLYQTFFSGHPEMLAAASSQKMRPGLEIAASTAAAAVPSPAREERENALLSAISRQK